MAENRTNLERCYQEWYEANERRKDAITDTKDAYEQLFQHILKHHWAEFVKIDMKKLHKAMEGRLVI